MKVRLKQGTTVSAAADATFQFHEGPIKTGDMKEELGAMVKFQFHEGPIKTCLLLVLKILCLCFNSMKVRLKHQRVTDAAPNKIRFQFHEGPIKTIEPSEQGGGRFEFQFHEGPIKTRRARPRRLRPRGFNSMKVRLKL